MSEVLISIALGFIHTVSNDSISFFLEARLHSIVHINHFLNPCRFGRWVDWFFIFATMNTVIVDILVWIFLDKDPEVYIVVCYNFENYPYCPPHGCTNLHGCGEFLFLPYLLYFLYIMLILKVFRWHGILIFSCNSSS